MQFKTVGNFLNKFTSNGKMDVAKEFQEMSKAQQAAILSSSALSATQKQLLVENVGLTASQTAATASTSGQTVATNGLTASQTAATASTSGFSAAMIGLGASIKSTFLALATNPLTWVVGASVAFAALMDAITVDYDEANKAFQESFQKYQDTKTNLESLNAELETTKNRISELQVFKDADTITSAQKSELEILQSQNSELERKIQLEENLLSIESKEAINDAKEAMNKKDHSVASSVKMGDSTGKSTFKETTKKSTDSEAIKDDLKLIKEYEKEIPKLEEKVVKLKEETSGKSIWSDNNIRKNWELKKAEKELTRLQDSIGTLYSDIGKKSENVQNQLDILKLDPKANKDQINELEKTLNSITDSTLTSSGKAAKALSEIWNNDSFAVAQQKLVNTLRNGKDISVKDITNDFPELTSACEEAGISVETLRDELIALSAQGSGTTKIEDDFNSFKNSLVSAINSIDTINSSLANSFSGKGLSISFDEETGAITGDIENIKKAYQDLDGYDASVLFERTANGIHLNREALRQLQAQQESLQKKTNLEKIIDLQNRLNQATLERDSFQKDSDDYNTSQSIVNDLENQLQIAQELASAYDGATSAYQKWVNAQANGEEGDMFRSVSETMRERGEELYKEGRYNTNEFRAIADYFSNQDLSTASVEELVRAYESAKPTIDSFFTGNKEGIDRFVASMKQLSDSENLGWVEELGDGKLKFNTGSDDEIAERLGISKEAVQSLYRAMTEYTDDFVIGDTSGVQDFSASIDEMRQKADEAKSHLEGLSNSNLDLNFNFDSTSIEDLDSQIERAKSNLEQFKNQDGNVDLSIDGAESAIAILQTLIQQKQLVSQPEIMTIDTSNLDANVANVISKLQEYQTAVNELSALQELQSAGIQIDTSQIDDAKAKVDGIFSEIQEMSSEGSLKINADVSVDTTSMESLNTELKAPDIVAKIVPDKSSLLNTDTSTTSTATVNYTKGSQENPEDKNAKVNYDKGKQEKPDDKNAKVNYNKGKQANPTSPKTATVNYKLGTVEKPPEVTVKVNYDTSGKPKVNGTAHANGTTSYISSTLHQNYSNNSNKAHAGGSWGLQHDENGSLINELGGEIIVRNGEWFVLNNGYPTLANLKQGDIVFNHKQSEQILKNGYVTGSHGKLAYSNGSAFSAGSWTMGNTGNGNLKGSGSYNAKKSTSNTNKNTKAVAQNTKATEDNTKEQENLQDWIAHSVDVHKSENERLSKAIESFEMHANQNAAIDKYVADSKSYMNTLRNAQNAYMQKANALGLDGSYVHKIWAGDDLSIQDIQDEELKEKIDKYTEWYNKAKDLGDQMTELNQKIREAKISKLDNIQDDYDNLVSFAEGLIKYNEAVNELFEDRNLVGSQESLLGSMNQQLAIRQALVNEQKELNEQLDALVASGDIAEYTDTWLKWKTEINDVATSIVEADSALEELKQSIREIRYKGFEDSLETIDFDSDVYSSIRDLMSKEGIYDDDIRLTDSGKTQLGLMGQELVAAKQKVANYNTAIEALTKDYINGNITQAQFNKQIREYKKDQLDAVKATKEAREAILDLIKDGIEKETEAMEELISKRKEDLSKQKEYYDFQKKMSDQSKEMNKIRAQIAVLQGDDSLESIAKLRKLQSQLQELQDRYNEDQRDHEYDIVQDAYDDTLDKFKENQEETLHELETSLTAQNQAISNALEVTKASYDTIYGQLNTLASQYNITLTESLTSPWSDAQAAIDAYQQAIGKLQGNISIDTSVIKPESPSANQTTPTKNEAANQNLNKSANGTWVKQDDRWWYQHDDGKWTENGWELIDGKWYKFDQAGWMQSGWQAWGKDSTGNTAWYHMGEPGDGSMKASQWINDNGTYYYVDHTGVMARNGYIKSASSGMYYWVNGNGVWEPQWDTYNPDLSKYKLYYANGKKSIPNKQVAYFDDTKDHKLDLGSEMIITRHGVLKQFDAGDSIFNKQQVQRLHEITKGYIPHNTPTSLSNVNNIKSETPKSEVNVHYDNVIGNIEYVDKNALPGLETIVKRSFDYTVKQLKKYDKR